MALQNGARERDSRFLSLFTVVRYGTYCVDIYHTQHEDLLFNVLYNLKDRFPNTMCLTSSNDNGTCYTQQVSHGTR